MNLAGLSWWQTLLLTPGMLVMDWLARTWPLVVIRHDFGFSVQSYLFWSAVISALFWTIVVCLAAVAWRRFWRWFRYG
ncbi:hypothetical protein M0534_04865 [Methylonatrum kenyense]|uniref:hypothetical protein n=1 Tax=Methylonatrum kenyense TaxID=455253 RepID=UPI0020BE19ED|nr:hypothetical protein [Methylonatrum kenyense]MCK8515658.1 hypothetical protein [Methylonatrum kenyense]